MTQARIAKGSREYLLDRAERLTAAFQLCSDRFERWGARRVIPSTFQPLADVVDLTTAITFAEPETGRLLAMRQDLTNQIRRIVEFELAHLKAPYKLYYIERVWRSRSDGSRAKEQIQAGVEWIRPGKAGAEAELLALAADLVKKLTGKKATLVLSHAGFRPLWRKSLKLRDAAAAEAALDQRNLSAWQKSGDPAYPDLPWLTLPLGATHRPKLPPAIGKLAQALASQAKALPKSIDVVIDPIGRSEHDYYTGMFFGFLSGIEHDPWLRGGRYDARFSGKLDAIGFALDLDTLSQAADHGAVQMPQAKKR